MLDPDTMKGLFHYKTKDSSYYSSLVLESVNDKKKVGDRVAYPFVNYTIGGRNPTIGTIYECLGRVTHTSEEHAQVKWDNSRENSYFHHDLLLVREAKDPNIIFRNKKRERR